MDVNTIFNAGGQLIENPDWSPSNPSVPKYINVADVDKKHTNNILADFAYNTSAQGLSDVLYRGDVSKYIKHGVTPNKFTNIDAELADAQSNWVKAGNALAQTLVSEVGLGTFRAGFDIFDFVASKLLHIAEDDYQNPASEAIQQWQDTFKNEIAPIYTNPEVNIQNGGLKDFGWWMSNVPTIASSLTLLLPTKGISVGLGALARAGKAGKLGQTGRFLSNGGKSVTKARKWASGVNDIEDASQLTKFQTFVNNPLNIAKANAAAKTVAEASLMRTMENYQEARDTYLPVYQEASEKFSNMSKEDYDLWLATNKDLKKQLKDKGINTNDRDAVAKFIAKKAADRTFAMDWSNIVWDVIQLHSLSNLGKGVKEVTNRAARKAQEEALIAAGNFAKGTAKEVAKTPWYKTVGHTSWELAKDGAKLAISEGNEAIEEAVNYIAQQEGLTYGKALLDGKEDVYGKSYMPGVIDSWRFMQGDLSDYMKTAELQESAFWGFMGGITFGILGGGVNKAELAIKRKAAEKSRKEDKITGEKIDTSDRSGNPLNSWVQLLEASDTKAAREAINRRQVRLSQVAEDLKQIENGYDVLGQRDADGKVQQFTGSPDLVNLKKETARQQIIDRFVADITMDAMNSGTFNLLLDYFEDKRVQEALVKAGITTQEQMQVQAAAISNQIKKTKDDYAKQSAHVLNQITAINADRKNAIDIPFEYAQIIAKENMNNHMDIESLNRQIAVLQSIAAEQESITPDDTNVLFSGAKEAVRLGMLTDLYGKLSADEKTLKAQNPKTGLERINQYRALNDIKAQKEQLAKEIARTTVNDIDFGVSALFRAFKIASSYIKKEDNTYDMDNSILVTDEEILKDVRKFFGDNATNLSDESIVQAAKKLDNDYAEIAGKKGLAEVNAALFNTYASLSLLELNRAIAKSKIKTTKSQIADYVDALHNGFNEARKNLVAKSEEVIMNAYIQNKEISDEAGKGIIESIIAAYQNDKQEARRIAEQVMSTTPNREGIVTVEEFLDALDIMNFSSTSNQALYEHIAQGFEYIDFIEQQEKAEQEVKNARGENPVESEQTQSADNSTQQGSESNTTQQNSQNEGIPQSISNLSAKHGQIVNTKAIRVVFDKNGKINTIKDSKKNSKYAIMSYRFEDGTVAVDIESLPKSEQLKYITNNYFTLIGGINWFDENTTWKINEAFTIKRSNKDWILDEVGSIIEVTNQTSSPVEDSVAPQQTTTQTTQTTQTQQPTASSNQQSQVSPAPNTTTQQQSSSTGQLNSNGTQGQTGPVVTTPNQSGFLRGNGATPAPTTPRNMYPNAPTPSTPAEPEVFSEMQIDILESNVAHEFGELIPDRSADNIDYDGYAAQVKERIMSKKDQLNIPNLTDELLEEAIVKQIEEFKFEKALEDELKNDVDRAGAGLAFAAKYEEIGNGNNFSSLFTNAAELFLSEYENVLVVPIVNGKKVVSLEEILRICHDIYPSADTSLAKHLYDLIKNYLNTPAAKAIYTIVDEQKGYRILEDLNKSLDEIREENSPTQIDSFRVNLPRQLEHADASLQSIRDDFYKTLAKLQVGDKVDVFNSNDELVISVNGITIGTMTKPIIEGDVYKLPVQGWVTDVKMGTGDMPISKLKDVISDLLTGDSGSHTDLRRMLTDYITRVKYIKNKATRQQELDKLIQAFQQLDIINDLVIAGRNDRQNSVIVFDKNGDCDYADMFNYLTKLWDYTFKTVKAGNRERNINVIKQNINTWFKSIYNNYDAVNAVNSNFTTEVSEISEGQVIRVVDKILENYDALPLANEALADFDNARLATVDVRDNTKVKISGKPAQTNTTFKGASTMVALFSRNKYPDYVNAIGVKLNDNNVKIKNSELGNLLLSARDAVENVIKNVILKKEFATPDELLELIYGLVATKDNPNTHISLFKPLKYVFDVTKINYKGSEGVTLYNNGRRLQIFTKVIGGGVGYKTDTMASIVRSDAEGFLSNDESAAEEIANQFISFISDICTINMSSLGITMDSMDNTNYKGFINKKNGKLVVEIPNKAGIPYRKEFDSYNDFLIQGGLIKVNTNKGKNGTNFDNRGDNQMANQNLYINLPIRKKQTKTTTTATKSYVRADAIEETYNNVKSIINSNNENTGVALFNEILGEEEYKRFTNILNEYNILDTILPESITWYWGEDKGKHLAAIAYSNPKDSDASFRVVDEDGKVLKNPDKFRKGVRVLVDSRWANMASSRNRNRRRESIRKLIHEQLHLKLGENPEERRKVLDAVDEIYQIYDKKAAEDLKTYYVVRDKVAASKGSTTSNIYEVEEYLIGKERLTDEEIEVSNNLNKIRKILAYREALLSYQGDTRLEEFLVESITSSDMYDYLNHIDYEAKDNNKKDTLFTKLIKAIAKFFGWSEVRDNSLLMHELNVLRDIIDPGTPSEVETEVEESTEQTPKEEPESEDDSNSENEEDDEEAFLRKLAEESEESEDEDDDYALSAAIEETTTSVSVANGEFSTKNIEAFKNRLPIELRSQFESSRQAGEIEITCH